MTAPVLRALQALRAATNTATDLAHAGEPIGDGVLVAYHELRRCQIADARSRAANGGRGCPVCSRPIGTRKDGQRKRHRKVNDYVSPYCTGGAT